MPVRGLVVAGIVAVLGSLWGYAGTRPKDSALSKDFLDAVAPGPRPAVILPTRSTGDIELDRALERKEIVARVRAESTEESIARVFREGLARKFGYLWETDSGPSTHSYQKGFFHDPRFAKLLVDIASGSPAERAEITRMLCDLFAAYNEDLRNGEASHPKWIGSAGFAFLLAASDDTGASLPLFVEWHRLYARNDEGAASLVTLMTGNKGRGAVNPPGCTNGTMMGNAVYRIMERVAPEALARLDVGSSSSREVRGCFRPHRLASDYSVALKGRPFWEDLMYDEAVALMGVAEEVVGAGDQPKEGKT